MDTTDESEGRRMWFDCDFLDAVDELNVPTMGAQIMAPLIYSMIRFVRARSVLEAGMGYTTPFIAKALRDNQEAFEKEKRGLLEKSARYLADIDAMENHQPLVGNLRSGRGLSSIYAPKSSKLAERRADYMFSEPAALLDPGYYVDDLHSKLYCVDNIASKSSSAGRVEAILSRLELSSFVSYHQGDFWSMDFPTIAARHLPFDLIWLDLPITARNVVNLLSGAFWRMLRPEGGLLIIHDMLTNEGGQMLVKEFFKADQRARFDEFEFVGLMEPQRVIQNSFVLIRKTVGRGPEQMEDLFNSSTQSRFEIDARALLSKSM